MSTRRWYRNWKTNGDFCAYCGEFIQGNTFTIDHIKPKSLGGKNIKSNYAPSCKRCNVFKGDLTAEEYIKKHTTSRKYFEAYMQHI